MYDFVNSFLLFDFQIQCMRTHGLPQGYVNVEIAHIFPRQVFEYTFILISINEICSFEFYTFTWI